MSAAAPATALNGAKILPASAPRLPRSTVRREGWEMSWMLELEERLLSSMVEKSFAMV